MSDHAPPRRSIGFPAWPRRTVIGLCAGVVLGGWCLWLGMRTASETTADATDDLLPAGQIAAPEAIPSPRMTARITEIRDGAEAPAKLIHAVVQDESRLDREIVVAEYSPTAISSGSTPRPLSDAAAQSGAWLTGAIEIIDSAPADRLGPPAIPAWKRTTKSLRNLAAEGRPFAK